MKNAKPSEVRQPMPTVQETKPRSCLKCGFLTIAGRELSNRDRTELGCYSRTGRGRFYWTSGEMPLDPEETRCFRGLWKGYDPDWTGCDGDGFVEQIERPRDDCDGFAPHEEGMPPLELLKLIRGDVALTTSMPQKPAKPKGRRGRPEDENVTRIVEILRKNRITNARDLRDRQKCLNPFAQLEEARATIPGIGGRDWMDLLNNDARTAELKSVCEDLRKALARRKHH